MDADLDASKKRKRVFVEKEAPFPVPISSLTGEPADATRWSFYTGVYIQNSLLKCCLFYSYLN